MPGNTTTDKLEKPNFRTIKQKLNNMNKIIFWTLAAMMTASGIAYWVTNNDTAFLVSMIFGAAALIILNNKLKPAQ